MLHEAQARQFVYTPPKYRAAMSMIDYQLVSLFHASTYFKFSEKVNDLIAALKKNNDLFDTPKAFRLAFFFMSYVARVICDITF